MRYPNIINEIINNQWAMRTDAFDGVISIIDGREADRELFHAVDEMSRIEALTGNLGDPVEGTQLTRIKGNVGFLDIDGPIVHRSSGVSKVSGLTSIQGLTREFQALQDNPSITDIVLLFDTPGGVVKGTSEFADLISKSEKNVIAYVWGTAASAGYWMASAADKIVSSDTGIVGSIGVVLTYDLNKTTGVGKIVSSQSPNKNLEYDSPRGKKSAQRVVDDLAKVFIGAVANGRSLSPEIVTKEFGKGDVFVAAEALKRGMIDAIQPLAELISELVTNDNNTDDNAEPNEDALNKNIDNNVNNVEIKKQSKAVASTSVTAKKGARPMTLKEIIAENPGLGHEIDAIKKEAYETGIKTGEQNIQARIDKVVPYFENENYPKQIAQLCIKVLKGEHSADALVGAITVFDAQAEYNKLRGAQADSQNIGATPSQQNPVLSQDGVVKTVADEEAMLARLTGAVN